MAYPMPRPFAGCYAALIEGGVGGIQLLSKETVDKATVIRRRENAPFKETDWIKFGLGHAMIEPSNAREDYFGQGGTAGRAEGFAVRSRHLEIALVKNGPLRSSPVPPIHDMISEALNLNPCH